MPSSPAYGNEENFAPSSSPLKAYAYNSRRSVAKATTNANLNMDLNIYMDQSHNGGRASSSSRSRVGQSRLFGSNNKPYGSRPPTYGVRRLMTRRQRELKSEAERLGMPAIIVEAASNASDRDQSLLNSLVQKQLSSRSGGRALRRANVLNWEEIALLEEINKGGSGASDKPTPGRQIFMPPVTRERKPCKGKGKMKATVDEVDDDDDNKTEIADDDDNKTELADDEGRPEMAEEDIPVIQIKEEEDVESSTHRGCPTTSEVSVLPPAKYEVHTPAESRRALAALGTSIADRLPSDAAAPGSDSQPDPRAQTNSFVTGNPQDASVGHDSREQCAGDEQPKPAFPIFPNIHAHRTTTSIQATHSSFGPSDSARDEDEQMAFSPPSEGQPQAQLLPTPLQFGFGPAPSTFAPSAPPSFSQSTPAPCQPISDPPMFGATPALNWGSCSVPIPQPQIPMPPFGLGCAGHQAPPAPDMASFDFRFHAIPGAQPTIEIAQAAAAIAVPLPVSREQGGVGWWNSMGSRLSPEEQTALHERSVPLNGEQKQDLARHDACGANGEPNMPTPMPDTPPSYPHWWGFHEGLAESSVPVHPKRLRDAVKEAERARKRSTAKQSGRQKRLKPRAGGAAEQDAWPRETLPAWTQVSPKALERVFQSCPTPTSTPSPTPSSRKRRASYALGDGEDEERTRRTMRRRCEPNGAARPPQATTLELRHPKPIVTSISQKTKGPLTKLKKQVRWSDDDEEAASWCPSSRFMELAVVAPVQARRSRSSWAWGMVTGLFDKLLS